MKNITLDDWERKYVVGSIARFDQKYTMFKRPMWDTDLKGAVDDWSIMGEAKDKPGFTLEELAFRRATSTVSELFEFLNVSKPNSSAQSRTAVETIRASQQRRLEESPETTKLDTSNLQRITRNIKKTASYFGADLVGICQLDWRWIYSHTYGRTGEYMPQEIPDGFKSAIVLGYEMDYNMYRYYNTVIAGGATGMGYGQMAITNAYLSAYIRALGFRAIDCTTNDVALSIPMAMQAGLGDIGRNGLLISREFGPRIRLSKVITDLPLLADKPMEFGVTEFCNICQKCVDYCPSRSITYGKRTTEPQNKSNSPVGLKWPVNAESCRIHWSRAKRGGGCTMCISVCPYNKPHNWFHRNVRWFTEHVKWADPLYKKIDDILGYGKPGKAETFWDEWQP